MPKTNRPAANSSRAVFSYQQVKAADMTQQHDNAAHDQDNPPTPVDTIKTRIVAALAEARKARHHKECHCRRFDGRYCNAVDALWQRALERELGNLHKHGATQHNQT